MNRLLPLEITRRLIPTVTLSVCVTTVLSACGGSPPPPPTGRVERGEVSTKVSASGALSSISSVNLGFPKGAQLKEIDVKVGDQVKAGQVLARLDPFTFQQQLNQQQAQLQNQRALLNKLLNENNIQQADRSLDQSRKILGATQKSLDAQKKLDNTTVNRSEIADRLAQRQLNSARRNLDFCRSHGAPNPATGTPALFNGRFPGPPGLLAIPGPSFGHRDRDGVLGGGSETYYSAGEGGADPCSAQVAAIQQARTNANSVRTNLLTARKQKEVNETQGQISVENARATVVTNQNGTDTARADTPANIDAQRALVANAAALVAQAQKDLNDTVLRAPTDGAISTINGAVGEYVGAETGLTSQSPGSAAAIPGVGAAATSSQNQISVSTNGSRNGGTFMVLNNIDTFQVVVPFEESDAAKVNPNAPVEVSFDALPDLTRDGRVVAVAPTGTDISGVTNYYATIVLTDTDPRLRDGQTAEADVLTQSKDNVLVVPNNAVIKQGGQSYVSVPGPNGQITQLQFQPGVVGDDKTEVLSGLQEGQPLVMPQTPKGPPPSIRPHGGK